MCAVHTGGGTRGGGPEPCLQELGLEIRINVKTQLQSRRWGRWARAACGACALLAWDVPRGLLGEQAVAQ